MIQFAANCEPCNAAKWIFSYHFLDTVDISVKKANVNLKQCELVISGNCMNTDNANRFNKTLCYIK